MRANAIVALLRSCTSNKDLHGGIRLHDHILRRGLLEKCCDALVTMYAKCGDVTKAKELFDTHGSTDILTWTALIAGYVKEGQAEKALKCFDQMQHLGLSPDAVTYSCALKACSSIHAADKGKKIHDEISVQGFPGNNLGLGNALADMYAKCGALPKARQVIEDLPVRDVISWTILIVGCADYDDGEQALECFDRMQHEGLSPDARTFACILKACGRVGAADKGARIHDEITKHGFLKTDVVLGNALVDMYAKCGELSRAWLVLGELHGRDVVSWNALITGYVEHGEGSQALDCLEQMQSDGVSPDKVTFLGVLKACGSIGDSEKGELIHGEIAKQGLLRNNIMLGTALVDMYAKCGTLAKAEQVLEELPVRDVYSWTALIAGYAEHGKGEEALKCLDHMEHDGISPNDAACYVCILKACSSIGAVVKGGTYHKEIAKQGLLGINSVLGNALVDMYAKCGALAKAWHVLEELSVPNVISWNSLIAGYATHGQSARALSCFRQMQCEGVSPDSATLASVLSAWSRLGQLEEAQACFLNMSKTYGLKPHLDHYAGMVDVYGRLGHIDRAIGIIEKTPSFTNVIWSALLGACRKWGDVEVARWAFEHALQLDETDAALYAIMASIYTTAGMLKDAEDMKAMSRKYSMKKPKTGPWPNGYLSLDQGPQRFPRMQALATS